MRNEKLKDKKVKIRKFNNQVNNTFKKLIIKKLII